MQEQLRWRHHVHSVTTAIGAPSARCNASASTAPAHCAITNPGTLDGAIPAKLSENMRPNAAVGLAKEVDAVNQYAAPIQAATAAATREAAARSTTSSRPAVATTSASHSPGPLRTLVENCRIGSANIACVSHAPQAAPTSCAAT